MSSLAPGDVVSDRYRVVSALGQGAMGAVYLVEHVHMKKRFALKVLLPDMNASDEVRQRFEREARAAAHLEHPNIVGATDFGRMEDGAWFMVLEYVEGTSLRDVLSEGRIAPPRAVAVAAQIASALGRAHSLGLVHRDLKPDNVMLVRREEGTELVKVLDFGIAKATSVVPGEEGRALTKIGTVFGTPEYMAPEQARGESVDGRADLYALGVTLYEMLTGSRPFDADNPVVLLTKHVATPPDPPSTRVPPGTIPAPLEALTLALLAKDPATRPASAEEVQRALLALIDESPPSSSRVVVTHGAASSLSPARGGAPTMVAAHATVLPRALAAAERARALARQHPQAALAVAGGGALTVLVLGLILVLASRGPSRVALADGGAADAAAAAPEPSRVQKPSQLAEERLEAAAAAGLDELMDLERAFPKDPRVPRRLAEGYAAKKRYGEALLAVGRLAHLDAAAAASPEIDRIVLAAVSSASPDDVDAAFRLLEGPLGAHGADLLVGLALDGPHRGRAQKAFDKPDVRARASAAALVTMDLRDAKSCQAKKALLPRAAVEGDARTFALVSTYKRKSGCGIASMFDCHTCLRKDKTLEQTLAALEGKGK